jgi:hypothetical protein
MLVLFAGQIPTFSSFFRPFFLRVPIQMDGWILHLNGKSRKLNGKIIELLLQLLADFPCGRGVAPWGKFPGIPIPQSTHPLYLKASKQTSDSVKPRRCHGHTVTASAMPHSTSNYQGQLSV